MEFIMFPASNINRPILTRSLSAQTLPTKNDLRPDVQIRTESAQKQAMLQIAAANEHSALLPKSPAPIVVQSPPKSSVPAQQSPTQSSERNCSQKACNDAKRYSGRILGALGCGLVAAEATYIAVTNPATLLASTVLNPFWIPGFLGLLVEIGCQVHERCQGEDDVSQPTNPSPSLPATPSTPLIAPAQTTTMTRPTPTTTTQIT